MLSSSSSPVFCCCLFVFALTTADSYVPSERRHNILAPATLCDGNSIRWVTKYAARRTFADEVRLGDV